MLRRAANNGDDDALELPVRWGVTIECPRGTEAPNLLNAWIDPHWSGVWTAACQPSHTPPHVGVFVINSAFANFGDEAAGIPGLVKFHFHTRREKQDKIEMRYACFVPLQRLLSGSAYSTRVWTVADTRCDEGEALLPDVRVDIQSLLCDAPRLRPVPPLPDAPYYKAIKTVADWIDRTLKELYPQTATTGFTNLRTVLRDPFLGSMFPDLPRFFYTGECILPPTWACYSLVNALNTHGLTPDGFIALCSRKRLAAGGDKAALHRLLNVIRDMLVPWSFCRHEGRYIPDTWLGKACEDQPYTLVEKPGDRVAQQDDCEGRNQEACVHSTAAFVGVYLDRKQAAGRWAAQHFARYGTLPLVVSGPDELAVLMRCCAKVGRLLYKGMLQAHMCVGDAAFAASGVASDAEAAKAPSEGHSFGVLHYADGDLCAGTIMETTSWDTTVEDDEGTDRGIQSRLQGGAGELWRALQRAYKAECKADKLAGVDESPQPMHMTIRAHVSRKMLKRIYRGIITGSNCIFFGAPTAEEGLPRYGINVEELDAFTIAPLSAAKKEGREAEEQPFRVSIGEFLRRLADGSGPWPRQEEAAKIEALYRQCERRIPEFQQLFRPPPMSEETIMRRMSAWGPLKLAPAPGDEGAATFAFSWLADTPLPPHLQAAVDAAGPELVRVHNCMRSRVFVCRHNAPVPGTPAIVPSDSREEEPL